MVRSRPVRASEKIEEPHRSLKIERTPTGVSSIFWSLLRRPSKELESRLGYRSSRVGGWDDAACWLSVSSAIASGIEICVPEASKAARVAANSAELAFENPVSGVRWSASIICSKRSGIAGTRRYPPLLRLHHVLHPKRFGASLNHKKPELQGIDLASGAPYRICHRRGRVLVGCCVQPTPLEVANAVG